MAVMGGSSAAEVGAPLEQVRAFVQDVERAPQWQGGLTAMRALERDEDGRAVLCRAEADARVRTIRSVVRYSYAGLADAGVARCLNECPRRQADAAAGTSAQRTARQSFHHSGVAAPRSESARRCRPGGPRRSWYPSGEVCRSCRCGLGG
jgi:hypothetical protein